MNVDLYWNKGDDQRKKQRVKKKQEILHKTRIHSLELVASDLTITNNVVLGIMFKKERIKVERERKKDEVLCP